MPSYVLDTSAIMSVLFDEQGSDRVLEILETVEKDPDEEESPVWLPFIALMEVEYWLRRFSVEEARRVLLLVEAWPVHVEESNPDWRHEAARIKATTPLSVADAWVASLSIMHGVALVHKDPEFDRVLQLKAERLPYKKPSE